LNVLSLYVENLLLEIHSGENVNKEDLVETLKRIKNEIVRMNDIINNFTYFSKPETSPKVFNIKNTLLKALGLVNAQFQSRGIKIELLCTDDVLIEGYETLLEQVFINLLTNARDAFLENKISNAKIIIKCEFDENGNIYIHFIDNAGGVPPSIKEKIFNPYFTTKGPKGTGLGLYMSKKILNEKFDGDLELESIKGGSDFKIKIGLKVIKR
jgi:signal transduction histidine kinase